MRLLPLFLITLLVVVIVGIPRVETVPVTFNGWVWHADIADDLPEQVRGLSGRTALADDEAMLFVFPDADERIFWMKDMQFAIDIIWLRDGRVVGIARNVQPEPDVADTNLTRYHSSEPVNAVLEVRAGAADALHIETGQVMVY